MKTAARYTLFTILLVLSRAADAQTGCGTEHPQLGAFICYPNPAENTGDARLPQLFHLSAQGNAPAGRLIRRYVVLIDGRPVYEKRLAVPTQSLSIETNVKSPFSSGTHTLGLSVDGAGSAEIPGLGFHGSTNLGFCDPFSRVDARTCLTSSIRRPLEWSIAAHSGASHPKDTHNAANPFAGFVDYVQIYGQNLKSVEADVADAVAVDTEGRLYVASHSSTDVELRRYAPDGSLTYDYLMRSCGHGFLSVAAIAIDNTGRVWVAGNTTACVQTTPNALQTRVGDSGTSHGFVALIDTTKSSTSAPVYVTYLSRAQNSINDIRVDSGGNAYVTGTTASMEFPHESSFRVGEAARKAPGTRIGFVSVLNPPGSALQWSALLQGAELNALAIDGAGSVYVTGRAASGRSAVSDDVFVAAVSDSGRRLSYAAHFGGSGSEEGRSISLAAAGTWVLVTGSTDSPDFPTDLPSKSVRGGASPFAVALQPCRTGAASSEILAAPGISASPEIAIRPALDAFAAALPVKELKNRRNPFVLLQAARNCPSPTP